MANHTEVGYGKIPFYTPEDTEFYEWHAWTEDLREDKNWWWFKFKVKW